MRRAPRDGAGPSPPLDRAHRFRLLATQALLRLAQLAPRHARLHLRGSTRPLAARRLQHPPVRGGGLTEVAELEAQVGCGEGRRHLRLQRVRLLNELDRLRLYSGDDSMSSTA